MDEILSEYDLPTLSLAMVENYWQFYQIYGRQPAVEIQQEGGLGWMSSPLATMYLNTVVHTALASENVDAAIERMLAHYRGLGVQFVWRTWPHTTPVDLGARLLARGFTPRGTVPNMVADLRHIPEGWKAPTDLHIEQISDTTKLSSWATVVQTVYETSDELARFLQRAFAAEIGNENTRYRHYVAWLGGRAVATTSLFLGAGVAGIYRVATLPEYRRRGIAGAVMLRAIGDAAAAGYRFAVLRASEEGYSLYLRLGFRDEFRNTSYTSPTP